MRRSSLIAANRAWKPLQQITALVLLLYCRSACAVDPALDWRTIESTHFFIHYAAGNKAIAEKTAAIAETVHTRLTRDLDWDPLDKTHIVLSDGSDSANGVATPLFFNRSLLYLAPPTNVSGLEDYDDWLTTLITHEYTHIIHLDKAAGLPDALRDVFGRFFLLFPNLYQPAWMIEGLATLKETDIERGIGRGQSSLFAMMMRQEVADGIKPVSQVNLPIRTWPAGATRYLYGVYFMLFIQDVYGDEKLLQLIQAYSGNLLPFFINTTFNKILGEDVTETWARFESWLENRFQPQLESIEGRGLKVGQQITDSGYRTGPVRALNDDVYYVRDDGYHQAELVHRHETSKPVVLTQVHAGADIDVQAYSGVLVVQQEFCNQYSIYSDIYRYDETAGKLKRLTECGRYTRAAWQPDGDIIAVHHEAVRFELRRLDPDGNLLETLWKSTDGEILSQIDVSPDGRRLVAAIWRKCIGWNIELFDLKTRTWQALTWDAAIAAYPQFTPDGDAILFSYEQHGVYNLYRYWLKDGGIEKITNVTSGVFQTSQGRAGGPVYYVGYNAGGYDIYKLDDDEAIAEIGARPRQEMLGYDYVITDHSSVPYSPWSSLRPRWWFPLLNLSSDRNELGLTTAGFDALRLHNYALSASYDSQLEAFAGSLAYSYAEKLSIGLVRGNNLYRDGNGNLVRTRTRDVAQAVYAFTRRRVWNTSRLLLALVLDHEADDWLAPGTTPALDRSDNLLGIAWTWNSAKIFPLSISPNDGVSLRLVAEDSDTLRDDSPIDASGQVYTLDWKQYVRTGRESVLALRLLLGWGTDSPNPFELGGEGSGSTTDLVFLTVSGESVFDQRDYPLRGYAEGLPQLRGRRAQLLSAEWRFPIQRIERGIMAPPVGLMQWSGAVFVETGAAYQDSPQDYYSDAGIEINTDLNLFYGLDMQLRAGYAHGFDPYIGDDRLYLTLGGSF